MIEKEEGEKVVKIARKVLEDFLKEGKKPDVDEDQLPESLKENRGVFVTLNKKEDLRGCIGRPLPSQPFIEGLVDSAINAAVRDPRFPKVTGDELEDITIEVSVLTVPEEVDVESSENYPDVVEVGEDGLIVEGKGREGLLLPQVAVDNDWKSEQFLSQTCVKAGLSKDSWREGGVTVKKFSAQVFKEKSPGGEIVEKNMDI